MSTRHTTLALGLGLTTLSAHTIAHAQASTVAQEAPAPPPQEAPLRRHVFVYRNTFAFRVNPLGVVDDFRIGYNYRLFDNPRPLYRDAHVGALFTTTQSPAWQRTGVAVEVAPLTILQFSAQYELLAHYGILGTLRSFGAPTPGGGYGNAFYQEKGPLSSPYDTDPKSGYATLGHVLSLNALLQLRFGPVILRDSARFMHHWMNLHGEDRAYYDSFYDILAPGRGWIMSNDLDVWYYPEGRTFLAGLRYSVVGTVYDEGNPVRAALTDGGTATADNNQLTQRLGPVVGYTFFDHPGARFNSPTVLLIANWWLQHPYRTETQNVAIPYIALAFTFRGEL